MNFFNSHLNKYNVPKNMNFCWNLGFILGSFLMLQIITGVLLVVFYTPHEDGAFKAIRKITVEANFGWFVYTYHSMGVSGYFFAMACHIAKGIWFSSKFLPWSWLTGILIYLLSIAVAFMGYVLPFGQMSYWGAVVIKNLLGWLGRPNTIIFGSHGVRTEVIQRFFLLHFILPFVILAIVIIHIYVLHRNSSSNPLLQSEAHLSDRFYPTAFFSDLKSFVMMLVLIGIQVGYGLISLFQADPDNAIAADELSTPAHIIPEWYLLIFYASLKVFPTKITGLLAMAVLLEALIILFQSRFISSLLSHINFHRTWTQSSVSIMPLLAVLGLIGKLEANMALMIIGLVILWMFLSYTNKFLDEAQVRW